MPRTIYSEQFKTEVVNYYSSGLAGYLRTANHFGIAASMVRRWVLWFRHHGTDGLARKTDHYPFEFKLSVLQHMWNNSLSHTQVAAQFNIRNPGSVGIWERRHRDGSLVKKAQLPPKSPMTLKNLPPSPASEPDDNRSRKELLEELQQLRMENAFLKKLKALAQERREKSSGKKS